MSPNLHLFSLFQNTVLLAGHPKEESKVGVLFEVILTRGTLIISMVDMSFSLHTTGRMVETWTGGLP